MSNCSLGWAKCGFRTASRTPELEAALMQATFYSKINLPGWGCTRGEPSAATVIYSRQARHILQQNHSCQKDSLADSVSLTIKAQICEAAQTSARFLLSSPDFAGLSEQKQIADISPFLAGIRNLRVKIDLKKHQTVKNRRGYL